MSEYILKDIKKFHRLDKNATYIILINVKEVPPHIGMVTNGGYYSKSTQGGKVNYEFAKLSSSLNRKKIPTLLIKLNIDVIMPDKFFDYVPLEEGRSCLSPIKKCLSYEIDEIENAKYLFDVIDVLLKQNAILSIEELNCDNLIKSNELTLLKYSQEEIDKAIINAKSPC